MSVNAYGFCDICCCFTMGQCGHGAFPPPGASGTGSSSPSPAKKQQKEGDGVEGACTRCKARKLVVAKIHEKLTTFCKMCGRTQ